MPYDCCHLTSGMHDLNVPKTSVSLTLTVLVSSICSLDCKPFRVFFYNDHSRVSRWIAPEDLVELLSPYSLPRQMIVKVCTGWVGTDSPAVEHYRNPQ